MALRSDNCDRLINCATSKQKKETIKLHLSLHDLKPVFSIYYGRNKISRLMSFRIISNDR